MADFDELLFKVSGALYQQDTTVLLRVAEKLNISGLEGQTRSKLVRTIRDHVEKLEDDEEGVAILQGLIKDLESKEPRMAPSTELSAPPPDESSASSLQNEPPTSTIQTRSPQAQRELNLGFPPTYRKDLRIAGQVGDSHQKDGLSFSSLHHQINTAINKGYSEAEVVEAVLRAINPGLRLRSYLENYPDLTLDTLKTILKSHYQEKDATELYQELTNTAQGKTETPQSFVMRALDLRQRVIRASNESAEGLKYDEGLVRNMFLHAVMTGLLNDNVRQDLKHHLNSTTSDEELLRLLNAAVSLENKRQQKVKPPSRVAGVTTEDAPATKTKAPEKVQQSDDIKSLTAEIAELKSCLRDVQGRISQGQGQGHPGQRRPRGCKKCRQEGCGESCRHCYRCGADNHISKGCRQPANQGNGSGAPRGDQV